MAADALARLGFGWEIVPWACRYGERLEPAPPELAARRARIAGRLRREGWRAVVAESVPLLLPGVLGGAFHGALRVTHAVRLVSARPSDLRLEELAAGLAYWIECRRPLGPLPSVSGTRDPRVALASLPPPPDPGDRWLITDLAEAAAEVDGFAAAIDGVELPEDPSEALASLAALGRDLLLEQPHAAIAYCHVITGPLAVAELAPLLDRTSAQEAVAWVWQAMSAVHAAYRRPGGDPGDEGLSTWTAIVRAAVDSGDEHAIKGALACRTLDERLPDPRWRRAASRLLR